MKRHYKTKENRKLKPGEIHLFKVLKTIDLPNGSEFFVLVDGFGDKHLLPLEFYKNYPIKINSNYYCHVDKINCQGRIFLEPLHPFYELGKEYDFKFTDIKSNPSKKNREDIYYKMLGENGEIAFLNEKLNKNFKHGDTIRCKVAKIKKAAIFLDIIQ